LAGPLSGRHALVTGGSRGIGRAVSAALSQAGASVVVLGRDRAALERVVAAGEAQSYALADVTDRVALGRAISGNRTSRRPSCRECRVRVSKPFGRTDTSDFDAMLSVNLMGVVNAIQAVLPGMTERGFGRIVAVASTAGLKGYAYVTAYCAAKHAVLGLVRALASEVARTGVTVNAVCPGFTDTDLVASSIDRIMQKTGRSRDEALSELTRGNPQGRLVQPDEVADAVAWLCGTAAVSVTGQAIAVAGGEV
jgi:NAD(P)-dependent dehydrogenase (short-subunit alcohol dehydrogenase family)